MNELREAVGRLRSIQTTGTLDETAYVEGWKYDEQVQVDAAIVVEAYLSEHPADEAKAVTVEWLESVGFEKTGIAWVLPQCWSGMDLSRFESGWVFRCEWGDFELPLLETRGDVRKLCSVLGIELDEKCNKDSQQ